MSSSVSQINVAFAGSIVNAMLYGAYVVLALANMYLLARKRQRSTLYFYYAALLFASTTMYFGFSVFQEQVVLIDGPINPLAVPSNFSKIAPAADIMQFINFWIVGALLVYRCLIIWSNQVWVAILMLVLYFGTIGTGGYTIWADAHLGLHGTLIAQIPFWAVYIALNVTTTVLIVSRLLHYRKRARETLGPNHGKHYTTIVAMLIESAAIDILFEILAFATIVTNNPAGNVFLPMQGIILSIVPNLVIWRVATGSAFESTDAESMGASTLQFTSGGPTAVVNESEEKGSTSSIAISPHTHVMLEELSDNGKAIAL